MAKSITAGLNLKKAAIETVEVPSQRLAARIAAQHNTSPRARAEFAQALVNDVRSRAQVSLRKLAVSG